ncbi:GDS1 [Candida margitis]|uniref:GDS1 n=1 Tax=Candida margitis TaxID=1775924 RepID=UPI002226F7EC|nr:GDS1 [Candida margitis]KAI5967984.1 GDS1 [Candida margitis]
MALTDRRPMALSTNTPVSSPTFNPNTLGIAKKTKTRNNSLPLHPTEKEDIEDKEMEEDDQEAGLEQEFQPRANEDDDDMEDNHDQDHDNEHDDDNDDDDDDDEQHSIASGLGKMGIANDSETSSTSRSTSPDSVLDKNKSVTRESTPPTTTSTPSSSQGDSAEKAATTTTTTTTSTTSTTSTTTKKVKKAKPVSRAPIATGISTAIPVTGEKPKPLQKGDASLEDDVLYAIFVILYERDPQGHGFTVKQICDVLTEEHPQIANLSTKTSNLVSAKLNAYVKRVEKGDTSLKYAISRDWADASPKRMVYVYRGLLAPGFEVVAKKLTDELKQQRGEEKAHNMAHDENNHHKSDDNVVGDADSIAAATAIAAATTVTADSKSSVATSPKSGKRANKELPPYTDDSLEAGKQATLAKPRRQTMFDLGVTKNSFFENGSGFDKTNLFVPYASAPVTAALSGDINSMTTSDISEKNKNGSPDMMDLDVDIEVDVDEEDDDEFANVFADSDEDDNDDYSVIETIRKNGKRSKSMSYLSMTKKTKVLTAAAAAPRASRAPSSHSPNAAAAAAALHAAALRAISRSSASTSNNSNNNNNTASGIENVAALGASGSATCTGSLCSNKKWLSVIRSGFLSQDIGAPEDTSLSDIEKFFA